MEQHFNDNILGPYLEVNEKSGCYRYKDIKCSVIRGRYTDFFGTYCSKISKGAKITVEQVAPEAASIVIGYNGILTIEQAIEMVKNIQIFIQDAYIVDSLSDNYLGSIITIGNETTHITFPQIRVTRHEYNTVHYHNLYEYLNDNNVFNLVDREYIHMYGSDDQKYMCCLEDTGLLENVTTTDMIGHLDDHSYMSHTKVENNVLGESVFDEYDYEGAPETLWLPLILSPDYWRTITRPQDKSEEVTDKYRRSIKTYPSLKDLAYAIPLTDVPWTNEDYVMFVDMWNPNRVFDPVYWTDIGKAFRTLWKKDPRRGLTSWILVLNKLWPLSRQDQKSLSPEFVRRTCTSVYKTFGDSGIDIHTLAEYARYDSPEEYCKWHDIWFMQAFKASLRCTHRDVARAFSRMFWLEIVCMKGDKGDVFYRFYDNRLIRDYGSSYIKTLLNNDFLLQYNRLRSDIATGQRDTAVNQEDAKMIYTSIDRTIDALGNYGFKTKVVQELADMFRVDDMINYVDQNRELTLLKNGVMVVANGALHFRKGKLQDYLNTSFGGYYREEYSWDHPDVMNAVEWANITFVDPDTISFFWKFLASMYQGGNPDKKLAFFAGPLGNNMKTTWQNQISLVLGERCISMPINYFTMGKGKADGATPSTIRLAYGCRLMISEEPEEGIPILTSVAKAEVGNEKKYVRGNYQDGRDIIPQHKVVIVCNFVPPIHKEPAMEERVIVFPFESQAIYGAPVSIDEQFKTRKFPRDPSFDTKLFGMVDSITWIMAQFFSTWWNERLRNPPADVIRITNAYWDSTDKYSKFSKDYIIVDPTDSIDTIDLYNKFSKWHTNTYKKLDLPEKDKVVAAMNEKLGGEPVDGLWHGFGFRSRGPSTNQ